MVPAHGEGIQNNPMPESMGVLGTDHAHLIFDRAPVPVANRLGEEGEGLDVALGGFLVPSRISVAMTCCGLAGKALDLAVEHSKQRVTFGKPIAARQAIAFRLAEMAADLEAARQLTLYAASTWEATHDAAAESSMAKLFASEMLQRVTDGGASGVRRHRLLQEPDRAGLPRRPRAALRGGHGRGAEADDRPRAAARKLGARARLAAGTDRPARAAAPDRDGLDAPGARVDRPRR